MTSGDELKYRKGMAGLGLVGWVMILDYQPWCLGASLL
jgi:hypothetical protein